MAFDYLLVKVVFNLPSEGCSVVGVVGILSVILKSRPITKSFAKAKSNRKEQRNISMHVRILRKYQVTEEK